MKQELEWLEAQKLEISVDLFASAKQHLRFLGAVDRNRWLYDGPLLQKAIYRYNVHWLPLLAKHTISQEPLVPPLDCEWIWHCHRLNPVRYKSDCERFYGRILDNSCVVSSIDGNCKSQTEKLWKRLYPKEPYDIDMNKTISETEHISVLEESTTYDLVSAVKRQIPFYYQVSRSYVDNDIFLQEAVVRYKAFLYLIKRNQEKSIKMFCVPTYDIDLIWHTHQLHALSYCKDLIKMIGKVLEHDDTDSDRSKGMKLDIGFSKTTSQWEETFGLRYWKAGVMNRGNSPKEIATSPYVLSSKKPISKEEESQNVILGFLEVKVIEVMLEIVDVKNLQEAHKGKVFVLFSKTEPDALFFDERKVTVLSESCGEKKVALFKCEAKGEISFKLMSSKSKSLGFASLSLSEFLSPVTKLSVEKWLELTPAETIKVDDSNPISLRVAISFTPPIQSPIVLHMVESRKSLLGKSFTSVVDETETEVISLQMKNSYDRRRQVIGVKECGESYVLGEYDGSFWSLLDSKWLLKKISDTAIDSPLFEISGSRMVKVYSGRKLEYESKHCAKGRRSEKDFMTIVEFSKEDPYGKAIGLLDIKFDSFEANEKWLVLVGLVFAFILKKKGFCECIDIVELEEEETLMNVEAPPFIVSDGVKFLSKKLNASGGCGGKCGDMVEEEGAHCGGCGGGCGGGGGGGCGGGCGGGRCGGRCGGMTKIGGCGGGGCSSGYAIGCGLVEDSIKMW